MRQNFLMRLFTALLVLGLLSWGESFLFVSGTDFSFISSVSAQDANQDGAADEEEMAGDEEEYEEVEVEEEGEGEDGAVVEGEENAEGEAEPLPEQAAVVVPPAPQGPIAPTEAENKAAIEKLDHFGSYAALWKIIAAIVVYLIWVRSLDWISTDCIYYGFEIKKWVPISYGAFWGGMLVFWLIPFFWVSYLFLLAGCIVPLVLYVRMHNQDLSSGEQVFTPEHLRFVA
ncbi:MAG: hypothetical protein IJK97_14525, partial [Thermoguttaceae bacterium]|nr:hypothetical protein [Thermoguttaceae bacterium]